MLSMIVIIHYPDLDCRNLRGSNNNDHHHNLRPPTPPLGHVLDHEGSEVKDNASFDHGPRAPNVSERI